MKKHVLAILIFLLFPLAHAQTLFNGTIKTETQYEKDGTLIIFSYERNSDKVFVQVGDNYMIVRNKNCAVEKLYSACIYDVQYKNATERFPYYEVTASVSKTKNSLDTKTTVTPNALAPGQEAEFKIEIKNTNNFDATNVTYMQDLSPFYVKTSDCDVNGAKLLWYGTIKSASSRTCTAKIIPTESGNFSLTGDLSYFNSFSMDSKKTDNATVMVSERILKISADAEKYIEPGFPFYLNISLANSGQDQMEIEGSIDLHRDLVVLSNVSNLNTDANLINIKEILGPNSDKSYWLILKKEKEGQAYASIKIKYKTGNSEDYIEKTIVVDARRPEPKLIFGIDYGNLIPGKNFSIAVRVKNPSRSSDMTQAHGKLTANGQQADNSAVRIAPNEEFLMINNKFAIPQDSKNIDVVFAMDYKVLEASGHLNVSLILDLNQSSQNKVVFSQESRNMAVQNSYEIKNIEGVNQSGQQEQSQLKGLQLPIINPESIGHGFNKKLFSVIIGLVVIICVIIVVIGMTYAKRQKLDDAQQRDEMYK